MGEERDPVHYLSSYAEQNARVYTVIETGAESTNVTIVAAVTLGFKSYEALRP